MLALNATPSFAREHPPFRLGVNIQVVAAGFDLAPQDESLGKLLNFRPAESDYLGISLGYRWLAGTVSFKTPASERTRTLEGESRYRDYRLSYFLSNLGAEASYTRYTGYLIGNSDTLSAATLNGQTFYHLPDLETLGYGLNLFFVPNAGEYNLAAALDQTEIQDKSSGAWVLVGTIRYQKIQSNFPWVPAERRSQFGVDQDIRFAVTRTYGVGGGYSYNWVPSDIFFLSGLLALTLGYESVNYVTQIDEQSHAMFGGNIHFRIVAGVNVEEFIFTLGGYADYFTQETESVRISPNVNGAILTSVVRF